MVGVMLENKIEVSRKKLGKGDRIFLYTDGLVDVENSSGVEFGEEQLFLALKNHSKASASEFSRFLMSELQRHSGKKSEEPFADDITFLVVDIR
jgi:sigma-B regulation protein RsbU (phosphoserine phosphatase)